MKQREKKYLFWRKAEKKFKKWQNTLAGKVYNDMCIYNRAATHTWINTVTGQVEVKILDQDEIDDLLERHRNGEINLETDQNYSYVKVP